MTISKLALVAMLFAGLLASDGRAQTTPAPQPDASQKTEDAVQSDKSAKTPVEINQELIENAKKMPDGTAQPETGRAKPVENWFGCKPGNDKEACEAEKQKKSSESSDGTSTKPKQ